MQTAQTGTVKKCFQIKPNFPEHLRIYLQTCPGICGSGE